MFTFERAYDVDGVHEQLSEQRDLVNPVRRLRTSELFSDTGQGSTRTGGIHYTLDDHRDAYIDEQWRLVPTAPIPLRPLGAVALLLAARHFLGWARAKPDTEKAPGLVTPETVT